MPQQRPSRLPQLQEHHPSTHGRVLSIAAAPKPRRLPLRGIGAESELAVAFDHAVIGMALETRNGHKLRVNRACCVLFGYSEGELLMHPPERLMHKDDLAEEAGRRARLLAGELDRHEAEVRCFNRRGEQVWARLYCSIVRDLEGEGDFFIVQLQDIREYKRAEQAGRQTQLLMQMATQIGRLGAWALDVPGSALTWSEEVCAIHEVPAGTRPTLERVLGFFAPHEQDRMRAVFQACLRDGSPFDVEARIVTARKHEVWVHVLGEAQWDRRGRVVRLQGALQDISQGKEAALEMRQLSQRLGNTLESLTDAFFIIGPGGRIDYVNRQAERMLRRRREALVGCGIWDVLAQPHGSLLRSQCEQALDDACSVQCEQFIESLGIWAQVRGYPSEEGLSLYMHDATENHRAHEENLRLSAELEERVRQRTAELQAANKELEAFSYSLAHDLRTPLSTIDGFSQMLQQEGTGGAADASRQHCLERIRAGVKQMAELTEALLSLARLSRTSLHQETVDLSALTRGALQARHEQEPDREVAIQVEDGLLVEGDTALLERVVENLIGNAWKFTARSEDAEIRVGSSTGDDGRPVYFVRDNGAGFDMTQAGRLFEAFQRLHSAREFEGTGIGLATVHKIVTRHGGRIWAQAAPGEGATFFFTLGASEAPVESAA